MNHEFSQVLVILSTLITRVMSHSPRSQVQIQEQALAFGMQVLISILQNICDKVCTYDEIGANIEWFNPQLF